MAFCQDIVNQFPINKVLSRGVGELALGRYYLGPTELRSILWPKAGGLAWGDPTEDLSGTTWIVFTKSLWPLCGSCALNIFWSFPVATLPPRAACSATFACFPRPGLPLSLHEPCRPLLCPGPNQCSRPPRHSSNFPSAWFLFHPPGDRLECPLLSLNLTGRCWPGL